MASYFHPTHESTLAMFSQTVEYALRAVVHLAAHLPAARTTQQISRATKVPRPYLYKVLQALGREGIVISQRGLGGGIRLANEPAALSILAVVNAVEPIKRISRCPLGLAAHGAHLCPLHRRLDRAIGMVEDSLRQSTVADLLAEPTLETPTCKFPRPNLPAPAKRRSKTPAKKRAPGRKPTT